MTMDQSLAISTQYGHGSEAANYDTRRSSDSLFSLCLPITMSAISTLAGILLAL